MKTTREELERFLEGAPRDPGPIAGGLRGWTQDDGLAVCSHCAGRIWVRGFADAFRGMTAVFDPAPFEGCNLRGCNGPA